MRDGSSSIDIGCQSNPTLGILAFVRLLLLLLGVSIRSVVEIPHHSEKIRFRRLSKLNGNCTPHAANIQKHSKKYHIRSVKAAQERTHTNAWASPRTNVLTKRTQRYWSPSWIFHYSAVLFIIVVLSVIDYSAEFSALCVQSVRFLDAFSLISSFSFTCFSAGVCVTLECVGICVRTCAT